MGEVFRKALEKAKTHQLHIQQKIDRWNPIIETIKNEVGYDTNLYIKYCSTEWTLRVERERNDKGEIVDKIVLASPNGVGDFSPAADTSQKILDLCLGIE